MKGLFYCILAVLALAACFCAGAPEPVVVQGPGLWTANVVFTHPQQLVLRSAADNKPIRFWYGLVTINNDTGQDVGFYPKCDLMTDTFEILPAGRGVSGMVFEQIKRRHQVRFPLLEWLEQTDSKLLEGEDNAKDIAIIWPDFDGRAKGIKIFISGLSNETAAIDHPVARDDTGKPVKVFLRKTLELSYDVKGDPATRSDADIVFKGKRWVMR